MHSCHYKSESRFHRCHWTIDMPSKNNNNNNKTPENSVDISLHSEKANWKSTSKCYVIVWFQLKTSPSRRHNTCSPDDAHWLMYIKLLNLFFFSTFFLPLLSECTMLFYVETKPTLFKYQWAIVSRWLFLLKLSLTWDRYLTRLDFETFIHSFIHFVCFIWVC